MSRNFYDSDDFDKVSRGAGWRIMVWVAVFALFFAVLGWALWGLGVLGSPVKGAGDAYKTKNSGTNRIVQQAKFEDLYNEYQDTLVKLPVAKRAAKQNPDVTTKQTEYTGLVNYCIDVAGDYNAESKKYLAEDFKRIDLPYELDRSACTK